MSKTRECQQQEGWRGQSHSSTKLIHSIGSNSDSCNYSRWENGTIWLVPWPTTECCMHPNSTTLFCILLLLCCAVKHYMVSSSYVCFEEKYSSPDMTNVNYLQTCLSSAPPIACPDCYRGFPQSSSYPHHSPLRPHRSQTTMNSQCPHLEASLMLTPEYLWKLLPSARKHIQIWIEHLSRYV